MSKPPVTYGYDIRPQVLLDLDQLQKFVPWPKPYQPKNIPGGRKRALVLSQVFLHITAANYCIPG